MSQTKHNPIQDTRAQDALAIDQFNRWIANIAPPAIKHSLQRLPECDQESKSKTKRQTEFESGRSSAHKLLQSFSESNKVEVATDRSPIWPAGFVGSISHSDQWIWAAVAQTDSTRSVGIDTEIIVDGKTVQQLQQEVATLDEWSVVSALGIDVKTAFTTVFSAKEAFYKCWYPQNNEFFGFEHAAVEACQPGRLTIRTLEKNPNFGLAPESLDVFFTVIDNHVFTATWMKSDDRMNRK